MTHSVFKAPWLPLLCLLAVGARAQDAAPARQQVQTLVAQEYPSLLELYKHLHSHPELSFQETQSAARVAEELRHAGCDVTTAVGKNGVACVLELLSNPAK